jgi:hypothetical protein
VVTIIVSGPISPASCSKAAPGENPPGVSRLSRIALC